jgi:hypothetical protein
VKLKLTAATSHTDCNRDERAGGDVVAICLEHDVVMQGHDQHDAVIALEAGIASLIHWAEQEGRDPLEVLGGPPPAEDVARFEGPRIAFEVDSEAWSRA